MFQPPIIYFKVEKKVQLIDHGNIGYTEWQRDFETVINKTVGI